MWNLKKNDTNELIYETEIDSKTSENKLMVQSGQAGEGWIGGLGLAYAHYCICNGWSIETCCIAQGTLPNIL